MNPNVLVKINALDNTKEAFNNLKKNLSQATGQVDRVNIGFGGLATKLAGVAAAFVSVQKAYDTASLGVHVAADLETAEIGLKTLLGSADEARATVERLKVEAARTPFELLGLTQATQLLASVTKDGNKSIDIILDIGEALAAMGKGQAELDRIIVNLQQIAAVGRAASIDIKQFAFAGIPIYEMLTETTGKAGDELAAFIEEGGVTFDLLTQMFNEANNEGGRFFNAFVNQSGSFNQAAANMSDSFSIMMADMAKDSGLFAAVTDAMINAASAMSKWREITSGIATNFRELTAPIDEQTGLITHLKITFDALAFSFNTFILPGLQNLKVALEPLLPLLEFMATVIGGVLVGALHAMLFVINALAQAIGLAFLVLSNLIEFVSATATVAINLLTDAVRIVAAVFSGDWVGAIDIAKGAVSGLIEFVDSLIDKFERAIDLAREIGGGAIDFVKGILPGRASGGPVVGRTPYIVGEQGPELFVPNSSGNIIPNGALAGVGGYSQPIYVTISNNTFMGEQDIVEQIGDKLIRIIKNNGRL